MYRAVVLGLFVTTTLVDKNTVESACNKFGPHLTHCCNNLSEMPRKKSELNEMDILECYEKEKLLHNSSCYIKACIAKLAGYYGSDGKLDKNGFAKYMKKQLDNDMDFYNAIEEKCLNTDISNYGRPDMCDFIKIEICFDTILYAEKCIDWSDEGECKGVKDIIQKC